MQCPSCGHVNAAGARFCSQCGTRLEVICPSCATHNEPDSRFCTNCGTDLSEPAPVSADTDLARYVPEELLRKIHAARAGGTMRGERRTVTMLFADIQGSTAAAEHLDPEDWAEIINGAFELLIAPVYRYEGTLARLQGDAILAFFGAPIAHEDDPIRAVSAGLDIVDALGDYRHEVEERTGVPIAVRVGINTGLVVVGEVGSDLRVEYTALGDAINVAARMEQTADPGTVRVTEDTAHLLGAAFSLSDIGPVEVKGKAQPVRAFRVDAARPTALLGRGGDAPLVGREPEHAALSAVLDRLRDGIGGVCSLVGEAGIGKSRLLAALQAKAAATATVAARAGAVDVDLGWLDGRCRSFDTAVPYALFTDLLRRWWGLDDRPGESGWDTVAAAVERALGEPDRDRTAFLANIVGVSLPPEDAEVLANLAGPLRHERTTDAVRSYLEAEANHMPLLLALDDVHWADGLSLALTERLMTLSDTLPVSIVVAMRPYRDDPSWRLVETAGRDLAHRYTPVLLDALPETATRDLLRALLGATELDDETSARILDRANGNPLFVEELVRSLDTTRTPAAGATGGLDDRIDIPTTLSGLLTARLDQLDDEARLVAQVASVIGREVGEGALSALLDDQGEITGPVAELVRAGILAERSRRPEPLYAFRHALIEEAAYSTILLRTRRDLHRRHAIYLEQTEPDSAQEIARHYLAAGQRERAFPFLVRAGERATRTMALADAIHLFGAALDAVPSDADPDLVVRAHNGLGEAYGLIPDLDHATATFQQLLDYGRTCEQPSIQVTALNRLGLATAQHGGDFGQAEAYLAEARRIASEAGDELGLADYHMSACAVAMMQGDVERAVTHDAETARLGAEQGVDDIRLAGMLRRAMNLISVTDFAAAAQAIEEGIEIAAAVGAAESLAVLRGLGGAGLALADDDLRRAQASILDEVATLDRLGSFFAPHGHYQAAGVAMTLGDLEGAIAQAGEAQRLAQSLGQPWVVGAAASHLVLAYAHCGVDESLAELREVALSSVRLASRDFLSSTVWADLGWAQLALDERSAAAEDLAAGLEASSTTRFWERPRLLIGLALTALAAGHHTDARRRLDEATTYAAERAIRYYDTDLAFATGRLAHAEDRSEDAMAALERAQMLAEGSGRQLVERDVAAFRRDVARELGRVDEAGQHAEHARRLTRDIGATILDTELRESFLARSARPSTVLEP